MQRFENKTVIVTGARLGTTLLASHDARFVNSVNLPVDGGLSASNGQPPQA